MEISDPRFEKFDTEELSWADRIDLLPGLDGTKSDFDCYMRFKNFIELSAFESVCQEELIALSDIVHSRADLEGEKIENWINRNSELFTEKLFHIILEIEHSDSEKEFKLFNDVYLEKKEFQSVISFALVMDFLYFGDYEDRRECSQDNYKIVSEIISRYARRAACNTTVTREFFILYWCS